MAPLTLAEFEAVARERLDPVHYDFFAGGAGDETTLRANRAGFARLALLPRVLRGNGTRTTATTLFGRDTELPVVISPTAFHRLAHPDGELATARAAAGAGVVLVVSMAATTPVEQIAAAARAAAPERAPTLWFQLYVQPDLEFTEHLVRRAESAGCTALVVTVDSPVFGRRERDHRNGFHDLPAGLCCENLREPGGAVRRIEMSAELSWAHIDWLRQRTALPIVLKGVLHPEDALLAVEHGVDGLLVSNHGGRQLDTAPATVELLPEIAAAVAGRLPLLVDGGVRRGTDVVKALALGASAVGVGRPVLWGLAAAGERGVREVLALLREEVDHTLALCGAASPRELGPDLVRRQEGVC
ncbi:alpha-hydroxy acid oxidase [Goodfellowiella coeruleoviolacea]|uniref:4-hydroxymandelate oxidase n=1 Tax=Goodfellowiella coeruleoviolacea TaxID=334858 RepID=A0AAE3G8C2_9PSEU|nr:alpha-hydroxy acid oxidase [Goodfellowiella coeruleoviolacea]MCP2163532.1 4-hydroxymandelate oxidase [Goodfellowiella coeruleoviolacea]